MIDYNAAGAETARRYAHQNRLGSVVAVTDGAGAVVERHTYSPYGVTGDSASGFPLHPEEPPQGGVSKGSRIFATSPVTSQS